MGIPTRPGRSRPSPSRPRPASGLLATDLFTSKNFYKDEASLDRTRRYYRCNTPRVPGGVDLGKRRIGPNPPTSASWADCKEDFRGRQDRQPLRLHDGGAALHAALQSQAQSAGRLMASPAQNLRAWDGYLPRDLDASDTPGHRGEDWLDPATEQHARSDLQGRALDLGRHQPGLDHRLAADAGISQALRADRSTTRRWTVRISGTRSSAILKASPASGAGPPAATASQLMATPERIQFYTGYLPAPGPHRPEACDDRAPVVWRNRRLAIRN